MYKYNYCIQITHRQTLGFRPGGGGGKDKLGCRNMLMMMKMMKIMITIVIVIII